MKKLVLFFTIILVVGCNATLATKGKDGEPGKDGVPAPTKKTGVEYRILAKGEYEGRTDKSYVVISDDTEYKNIAGELQLQEAPEVNFNDKIVVVFFLGQKNTGGYSVDIQSVALDNNTTVITAKETAPTGMATMAITYPYCIVEIPKSEVAVKF